MLLSLQISQEERISPTEYGNLSNSLQKRVTSLKDFKYFTNDSNLSDVANPITNHPRVRLAAAGIFRAIGTSPMLLE
jgi:hypothetical protein